MSVLRIHKKQNNFVILDKTCLNEDQLSWGAKGLHAFLISLPDDWQIRVSDLQKRATNGRDAVRGLLNELELAGYIKKAARRNDENGRFGGMEYLVLETPEPDLTMDSPETEKLFSVINEQKTPRPENPSLVIPATGNPSPENSTLLNINRINNKKLNNKTATDSALAPNQPEKAAAVFSSLEKKASFQKPESLPYRAIHVLSQEDALIGDELTANQLKRVQGLVDSLNIEGKERLCNEIGYSLLDKMQFTGCGNDFSKKLNAIRTVMLRGDWQTPVGLVRDDSFEKNSNDLAIKQLETERKEAYAEAAHFKKLLVSAKGHTRGNYERIIAQTQSKILDIEGRIGGILSQPQQESC